MAYTKYLSKSPVYRGNVQNENVPELPEADEEKNLTEITAPPKIYNQRGNPFQRGNSWTFYYYITDSKGKSIRKFKGGYKTKKEAEYALKEYQSKANLNQFIPNCKMTLEQYLISWLDIHKQQLAPNTINGYYVNIHNHIIPVIGKVKLTELTTFEINRFYSYLLNEKQLSPKTIRYVHTVLRIALKHAEQDRLIDRNVCDYAKLPKINRYKSEVLTIDEINLLIEHCRHHRYGLEIILAITLGLRRGEVLGLKFSDCNFEKHTIHIQRQVTTSKDRTENSDGSSYDLKILKTENSDRILYMPSTLEKIILFRRQQVQNHQHTLQGRYNNNDLICCKDNGDILSPQTLYHSFKQMLKELDLPDIRFHDLRHSYATAMLDSDVPLKVISQNLGHSSIGITGDIYADSIIKKKESADVADNIFFNE